MPRLHSNVSPPTQPVVNERLEQLLNRVPHQTANDLRECFNNQQKAANKRLAKLAELIRRYDQSCQQWIQAHRRFHDRLAKFIGNVPSRTNGNGVPSRNTASPAARKERAPCPAR